jgi:3-phosphoshikimate 1-carboxyvinyltransferase
LNDTGRLRGASLAELPDPLEVPWARALAGELRPPPSKSLSHRYLTLALLLGGERRVDELLEAEDLGLFREALRVLGLVVEASGRGVVVRGQPAPAGEEPRRLHCGNAGTMFRFLTAALTTVSGRFVLDGTPRLRERPIGPLVEALREAGARIEYLGAPGCAPLMIEGSSLAGGHCRIDAGESSQYLSALLMAGLRAKAALTVEVAALTSEPYVALTRQAMQRLEVDRVSAVGGVWRVDPLPLGPAGGPGRVEVEPDFSAAAYPAAAAALIGGPVELLGLSSDSVQGDRRFLDLLAELGARVEWTRRGVQVAGGAPLRALSLDLSDMPDQVPTLAALAAFGDGDTEIRGVAHLRLKESDRLAAVAVGLRTLGFRAKETSDGLIVRGQPQRLSGDFSPVPPAVVDTRDDHRIAMAFALVGLRRAGTRIAAPAVVAKSYPEFWRDLLGLISE